MTTDWRELGPDPLSPHLRAALTVFVRHGYHGASIRTIADAAGLSVPGLYHHQRSKQAILDAVVSTTIDEMLTHTRAAETAAGDDPARRFDYVVECLIRFHMMRRDHAFIASTEIRSMVSDVRRRHVAQRDEQQDMIERAIADSVAAGASTCPDPRDAARAISALCVAITTWYRPDGPQSPDAIVDRYLHYARAMADFG